MAMQSESARAASATEARFRISDPNSRPRAIKVIALDRASGDVVKRLARSAWTNTSFLIALTSEPPHGERFSMSGWLSDLAGQALNLAEEIDNADLVVMIATAGNITEAASIIGEACSLKRVMTTVLILAEPAISDAALSRSLSQLRPWALMLVIASAEEYVADMLTALRA
jgi:uncharacterized protein (DUF2342 family)